MPRISIGLWAGYKMIQEQARFAVHELSQQLVASMTHAAIIKNFGPLHLAFASSRGSRSKSL